MPVAQAFRWAALDLVSWFLLPIAFLSVYVSRYPVSTKAIVPHLHLILIVWVLLVSLRLTYGRFIPREGFSRHISALILSLALFAVLVYYTIVIVGLESWGQVVTWDLIKSYARQFGALMDAVGVAPITVVGAIALLYVAVHLLARCITRRDWTWHLARSMPGWLCAFVISANFIIVAVTGYAFVFAWEARNDEPISMTIFPAEAMDLLQAHSIDRIAAQKQDSLEDAARAQYVPHPIEPTNVILIVVDALRPAHLGPYGYSRVTTPTLDQLAAQGRLRTVRNVHASCAESSCGLLSLLTSKFVHQFSQHPFALTEVLRLHGYRIHFILGGDHTNFYGLRAAYGQVDSYFDAADAPGHYANDDRLVVDRVAKLAQWDAKPAMLQLHLMSAHVLGKRHEDSLRYVPADNYAVRGFKSRANRASFVNYYDNGVLQADKIIGELLALLEAKGYLDRALVVITADHGEALGEHDVYAHANSVREEEIKIPLMLLAFGYEPKPLLDRKIVSQVDIAPTILAELGIPQPSTWAGVPLQESFRREVSFVQQSTQVGLIHYTDDTGLWKYWIDHHTQDEFAFDLVNDPGERINAVGALPSVLKKEWVSLLLKQRHVYSRPEGE